jgi:zinc transporter ZupT
MKNSKPINHGTFKGVGYLIGAIIGLVAAITVFIFTENIAISIPVFAGLSIPLGMVLEEKFQVQAKEKDPGKRKLLIAFFVAGALLFFSLAFIKIFN